LSHLNQTPADNIVLAKAGGQLHVEQPSSSPAFANTFTLYATAAGQESADDKVISKV
jgi:hypothetical protein